MKGVEKGGACSMRERETEKVPSGFNGERERKRPLERIRHRCDNIKIYFK
jgi:hypothetical protein